MYTRETSSWTIASEIMVLGAANGDTVLDCGYQVQIESFLDAHGSAATLGGWIRAVREYKHHASIWAMMFMYCHTYLRQKFPQDVLDDFAEIIILDPAAEQVLSYVAKGMGILPVEVEDRIRDLQPHETAMFDTSGQFGDLRDKF